MSHRPRHANFPVGAVCSEILYSSVCEGDLENSSKGGLAANHSIMPVRGYDFVRPPSRSRLSGETVDISGAFLERLSDVVGEGKPCLLVVGESRLEKFLADFDTVDEYAIDSKPGSHPDRFFYILRIGQVADKPACTVCRPLIVPHYCSLYDGGIRRGNPF